MLRGNCSRGIWAYTHRRLIHAWLFGNVGGVDAMESSYHSSHVISPHLTSCELNLCWSDDPIQFSPIQFRLNDGRWYNMRWDEVTVLTDFAASAVCSPRTAAGVVAEGAKDARPSVPTRITRAQVHCCNTTVRPHHGPRTGEPGWGHRRSRTNMAAT